MENNKDKLFVAYGEAVVNVNLFEVDLREVGEGGKGHASALGEETGI